MRRKPVTRSEVRCSGGHISTLPVDAVREDNLGYIVPIRKLWAPLLRTMNRKHARNDARRVQALQETSRELVAFIDFGPCSPVHLPDRYVWPMPRLYTCQCCDREFFRVSGGVGYCSDDCAESSRHERRRASNAAMIKTRSAKRAAARAKRRCAHCNESLTPQRSTGKYCSVRCRVAAHRYARKAINA